MATEQPWSNWLGQEGRAERGKWLTFSLCDSGKLAGLACQQRFSVSGWYDDRRMCGIAGRKRGSPFRCQGKRHWAHGRTVKDGVDWFKVLDCGLGTAGDWCHQGGGVRWQGGNSLYMKAATIFTSSFGGPMVPSAAAINDKAMPGMVMRSHLRRPNVSMVPKAGMPNKKLTSPD
jgi:hypothetical protein